VAELAGANELLRLEVAESVKAEETLRAVLILAEMKNRSLNPLLQA